MSLQKKILLGFLVSAACIAALMAVLFANFVEIKKETRFLEATDSIRSMSLQLRRHEKNFLLYAPAGAPEEVRAIHDYLAELEGLIATTRDEPGARTGPIAASVGAYREQFAAVLALFGEALAASGRLRAEAPAYRSVSVLVESNFLSQPAEDARYLARSVGLPAGHAFLGVLARLEGAITDLRRTGEEILTASKELDRAARENVDRFIDHSRRAIYLLAPASLLLGLGTLLYVTAGAVGRLGRLAAVVEGAGSGRFLPVPEGEADEVGSLIRKFNVMEERLAERERELLRAKKLAAIGTLASGVAHELNNPLSNISTTVQRLQRKAGDDLSPALRRGLGDIYGQTLRVKSIVGDLLEFARGREPRYATVELVRLAQAAWQHLEATRDLSAAHLAIETTPPEIVLEADPEQLERVFINLYANAVDALPDGGAVTVRATEDAGQVAIRVTDTGRGMSAGALEKLFEPFYTTKDQGTGLGLAIVFNIVEKHGGQIRVASEPGAGTTFAIDLPVRAAAGGEGA